MSSPPGLTERPISLRRRFTQNIKKVISSKDDKKKAGESTPTSPVAAASSSKPAAPEKKPAAEAPKPAPVENARTKVAAAHPTALNRRTGPPPPRQTAAERAQALFKKHGLEIQTSDWPAPKTTPQSERVLKPIRMRVHRTCHKCETPYGADKICVSCGHKRCKACTRYPVKKTKEEEKAAMEKKFGKKRKGDTAYGLTIPGRHGGPDLVRKQIRQRVHRKCHRCETDFGNEKICASCKHTRCKKCPRYPSKPGKDYSKHDPSDSEDEKPTHPTVRRTYKRPRRRVHWTCSKCGTTFLAGTKDCSGCGSHRDVTGVRDPPLKEKKKCDVSEDELNKLSEGLKQTTISA